MQDVTVMKAWKSLISSNHLRGSIQLIRHCDWGLQCLHPILLLVKYFGTQSHQLKKCKKLCQQSKF